MRTNRKKILLAGNDNTRLIVALVFVLCASFTALVHGAERSVEGLDIDTVVLRGSGELEISFGDEATLRVQGSEKQLNKQPFYVRGNTLYLGYSDSGKHAKDVKYKLTAIMLERIRLEGSGTVWVQPIKADELKVAMEGSGDMLLHSVEADRLKLFLAGSGNIQLAKASTTELMVEVAGSGDIDLGNVTATTMEVDMSGSGDIIAAEDSEGSAEEIDIGLAGSGDIDLLSIRAQRVDIGIAGSGDVSVWAESELDISIIGSGDVTYRGDPDIDSSVMGSGDVDRAD